MLDYSLEACANFHAFNHHNCTAKAARSPNRLSSQIAQSVGRSLNADLDNIDSSLGPAIVPADCHSKVTLVANSGTTKTTQPVRFSAETRRTKNVLSRISLSDHMNRQVPESTVPNEEPRRRAISETSTITLSGHSPGPNAESPGRSSGLVPPRVPSRHAGEVIDFPLPSDTFDNLSLLEQAAMNRLHDADTVSTQISKIQEQQERARKVKNPWDLVEINLAAKNPPQPWQRATPGPNNNKPVEMATSGSNTRDPTQGPWRGSKDRPFTFPVDRGRYDDLSFLQKASKDIDMQLKVIRGRISELKIEEKEKKK
ncbi:hypothetical protein BJX99DRAFT_232533 [Aspergillus californicus]